MTGMDESRMQQVIQEAFDKATGLRRWQTAIVKAKHELEENPYIHFDGQALLILSPSGEIYSAKWLLPVQGLPERPALLASRGGETCRAVQRDFALKRNGIGERANAPYLFTFNLPDEKGKQMQREDSTKRRNGGER